MSICFITIFANISVLSIRYEFLQLWSLASVKNELFGEEIANHESGAAHDSTFLS